MGRFRPFAAGGGRLAILLIASALLAGSVTARNEEPAPALAVTRVPPVQKLVPSPVPAPLIDATVGLRAGPVPVPLELVMPSLGTRASVLGVGMLANGAMDAPMGKADDPVWQQAFWYRGSAVPGLLSTAVIAGHISDPLGRLGIFGSLHLLRPGDPIVVHDTRSGLDVTFSVLDTASYPLARAADPAVLTQIYGAGPVAGTWPQPSADGLAHLTLVTCDGIFTNGTHDHRLVVRAVRIA